MSRKDRLIGEKELERMFEELGKVPQTVATQAARAGGRIALKAAKKNAPVDTGELRDGIILKRERFKVKGKAVFDVMMDPAKTNIYRRKTKTGMRRRGDKMQKGDYYYPSSIEYGFLTVDGGYVPGYRFLRRAIDDHDREIALKIYQVTTKALDKAMRKK